MVGKSGEKTQTVKIQIIILCGTPGSAKKKKSVFFLS